MGDTTHSYLAAFLSRGLILGLLILLASCGRTMREATAPVNYVPDSGYHLLMAEIALQRGAYAVAAQEYLTAAERSEDVATARRATEFNIDYGFDAYALRSAQRWLALEADSTTVREYLGRLYLRRHNVEQARENFAAILGPPAERSDKDYRLLADDLANEPNLDAVLRLLLALGTEQPPSASAGYRLAVAEAALRAGAIPLALFSAEQAVSGGLGAEAELVLSRALSMNGQSSEALDLVAALLAEEPTPEIELEFVSLAAAAGETELARRALQSLITARGAGGERLRLRALMALSAGQLDRADDLFNELAASGYKIYEAFYYLGQIAAEKGQFDSAARYLQRISAGRFLLPAQFKTAEVLVQAGDGEAALAHLDKFASAYPRYRFDIFRHRASLLSQLHRHDQAIQSLNEALAYKPEDLDLLLARGSLFEQLGRLEPALEDFYRALRLAPQSAMVLNSLGYTLANRTRRYAEAEGYIRQALQLEPRSSAIMDSLAWVLFRQGRLVEARSYLEIAYQRLPDPEVAAHLGEVLWELKETEAAREIWAAARQAFPDSKPLQETLERLLP